jgi:hypothetical protein
LVFGGLAWRRVSGIRRAISSGPEVKGRVLGIWFQKDRGQVGYEYEYGGETHQSASAIWRNAETESLQVGDEVTLIVDPEKPARAFLAQLYD